MCAVLLRELQPLEYPSHSSSLLVEAPHPSEPFPLPPMGNVGQTPWPHSRPMVCRPGFTAPPPSAHNPSVLYFPSPISLSHSLHPHPHLPGVLAFPPHH